MHLRYATDPDRPWQGIGPIQSAALAGKLSAETVQALSDESGSMLGYIAPIPKDGQDDTVSSLRSDLRQSRGRTHFVRVDGARAGPLMTREPARRRTGPGGAGGRNRPKRW